MSNRKTIRVVVDDILTNLFSERFKASRLDYPTGDIDSDVIRVLGEELLINFETNEIASVGFESVYSLVENNLEHRFSKSILDVYELLEKIAREEYHPDIAFRWFAEWDNFFDTGNFLTKPDPLDAVEVQLRIEDEFALQIMETEIPELNYIGSTVRYIWSNSRYFAELATRQ